MKALFRQEVLSSRLQRLEGEIFLVRPPTFIWLTSLITTIVITSLIFLANGEYARKQTAQGILQPKNGLIRLSTASSGTLTYLLVNEGDKVTKGQALLAINSDFHINEKQELKKALLNGKSIIIDGLIKKKELIIKKNKIDSMNIERESSNLIQQMGELDLQIEKFRSRLALNKTQLQQIQTLNGTGYISEIELNKQRDILLTLEQQERTLINQKLQISQELIQKNAILQQIPLNQNNELLALENEISEQNSSMHQLKYEQANILKSPINGVVSIIHVKAGEQLNSSSLVISLLPEESELEAVLYLPTRAIANVTEGQTARIRYHAFPYQQFGTHNAEITDVSSTVLLPKEISDLSLPEPSYRLRLKIQNQSISTNSKQLPLKAGMSIEADIITEKRTLLEWLLDPVYSVQGRL